MLASNLQGLQEEHVMAEACAAGEEAGPPHDESEFAGEDPLPLDEVLPAEAEACCSGGR